MKTKADLEDRIQNLLATIAKLQDADIPADEISTACDAVQEADDTLDELIFSFED